MDGELRKIKKLYGEDFAKFCRSAFPRILEEEGLLLETLKEAFPPSHGLYKALVEADALSDFKYHIFYRTGFEKYEPEEIDETPSQLLLRSGYSLYRCEREDDVMQFVRYYKEDELLCTFDDIRGRLDDCDVFFAVSFDADEIDRSDFEEPAREDKYGTSVISIQFDKYDGSLSIKNRYNHTVDNPDATFSNDLDNICPGLTDSFATHYGLYSKVDYSDYETFYASEFVKSSDGRYFHVKRGESGIYFCDENWVIKDDKATYYDKSRYEIFDYFILDKQEKRIFTPFEGSNDSFMNEFSNIKKIDVEKNGEGKKIIVTKNDNTYFEVQISEEGTITSYENHFQTEMGDEFLKESRDLKYLNVPKVKKIGSHCLEFCNKLQKLDMPELEEMGSYCLTANRKISQINLPKVRKIGDYCLTNCVQLKTLNLPEVVSVGFSFMDRAMMLESVSMPKLKFAGHSVLRRAGGLREVCFPQLETTGDDFLRDAEELESVLLPKLMVSGNNCLNNCYNILSIDFPELARVGDYFMAGCRGLRDVSMPKVTVMGDCAFRGCEYVEKIDFPELFKVGHSFFAEGQRVTSLSLPNLRNAGDNFLSMNNVLENLDLPNLIRAPKGFLRDNTCIKNINMPMLESVDENFMMHNFSVTKLSLPSLQVAGNAFFMNNEELREVSLPKLREVGVFFLCGSMDNLVVVDIPDGVKGLPSGIKEFQ